VVLDPLMQDLCAEVKVLRILEFVWINSRLVLRIINFPKKSLRNCHRRLTSRRLRRVLL